MKGPVIAEIAALNGVAEFVVGTDCWARSTATAAEIADVVGLGFGLGTGSR
jgi:hypothetical protein